MANKSDIMQFLPDFIGLCHISTKLNTILQTNKKFMRLTLVTKAETFQKAKFENALKHECNTEFLNTINNGYGKSFNLKACFKNFNLKAFERPI